MSIKHADIDAAILAEKIVRATDQEAWDYLRLLMARYPNDYVLGLIVRSALNVKSIKQT